MTLYTMVANKISQEGETINSIANMIGVNRNTLIQYLSYPSGLFRGRKTKAKIIILDYLTKLLPDEELNNAIDLVKGEDLYHEFECNKCKFRATQSGGCYLFNLKRNEIVSGRTVFLQDGSMVILSKYKRCPYANGKDHLKKK